MAFIPVLDVVKVEIRLTSLAEQVENTLYFRADSSITPTAMATLAGSVAAWWNSDIKPLQSASVQHREVYVTDLTTAISPTVSDTSQAGVNGTASGNALPNNVTIAASFRTLSRGRSARGRNYVVGLTEDQVTGNVVTAGVLSDYIDAYEALISPGFPNWTWGIVSLYTNNAPRVAGLFQEITNVIFADNVIDSARRRLPGRGD